MPTRVVVMLVANVIGVCPADALDADRKSRLCLALNVAATALVHDAVLVYSPTAKTLLSALAFAIATDSGQEPAAQWRFVSDEPATIETLAQSGGIALYLRDAEAASFQLLIHFLDIVDSRAWGHCPTSDNIERKRKLPFALFLEPVYETILF